MGESCIVGAAFQQAIRRYRLHGRINSTPRSGRRLSGVDSLGAGFDSQRENNPEGRSLSHDGVKANGAAEQGG